MKSNAPYSWAHAERRGLRCEARRRFRVSRVRAAERRYKVILEGADRALCGVSAVDMGRAKLEGDVLLVEEVDEGS